jgi:hypothetical protein
MTKAVPLVRDPAGYRKVTESILACRAASSGEVGEEKRETERRYYVFPADANITFPFSTNPRWPGEDSPKKQQSLLAWVILFVVLMSSRRICP